MGTVSPAPSSGSWAGRLQLSQSSLMAKITKQLGNAAEVLNALGREAEILTFDMSDMEVVVKGLQGMQSECLVGLEEDSTHECDSEGIGAAVRAAQEMLPTEVTGGPTSNMNQ